MLRWTGIWAVCEMEPLLLGWETAVNGGLVVWSALPEGVAFREVAVGLNGVDPDNVLVCSLERSRRIFFISVGFKFDDEESTPRLEIRG